MWVCRLGWLPGRREEGAAGCPELVVVGILVQGEMEEEGELGGVELELHQLHPPRNQAQHSHQDHLLLWQQQWED